MHQQVVCCFQFHNRFKILALKILSLGSRQCCLKYTSQHTGHRRIYVIQCPACFVKNQCNNNIKFMKENSSETTTVSATWSCVLGRFENVPAVRGNPVGKRNKIAFLVWRLLPEISGHENPEQSQDGHRPVGCETDTSYSEVGHRPALLLDELLKSSSGVPVLEPL